MVFCSNPVAVIKFRSIAYINLDEQAFCPKSSRKSTQSYKILSSQKDVKLHWQLNNQYMWLEIPSCKAQENLYIIILSQFWTSDYWVHYFCLFYQHYFRVENKQKRMMNGFLLLELFYCIDVVHINSLLPSNKWRTVRMHQ